MKRLILTLAVLALFAVPAAAQQDIAVMLSAAEVHAIKVTFGADADIQAKAQQWLHDWCIQFTRQVKETEQRELREALVTLTPEAEANVRKLLKVNTPVAVTAEQRAAKEAARLAEKDVEKAARQTERQAARAELKAELLAACKATAGADCSFIK